MRRGYKIGDEYSMEISSGLTRKGKIVRKDREAIWVVYNTEKTTRVVKIKMEDIYGKNKQKKV